ncbi:tRNA lysidine(34) synthetase TilS [Metamycoplasma hyosynoviae]|uniref:tRNA(Ile)-lysidine synthase n=1 Tax=Metamycoplasma hyosynoviae TaxID=29559 RepID=A0A4R7TZ39_9BACT|nr:tRNA lysidine(34) synthetase TilS [Metamycoplasma hyosynoviae]MDC8911595.1 tRNA lysidine(34) synthetase TilS [Metamycoplasma hyosynoviae]MDC8918281.1 tRNA lysidine(34) synthetase TilS [Metamycoplasma hyosynoviae]MDD1360435.1 tRNA lysidine(34) synthetase TilS [Metamycoplasma hyosynoviae]MDD1361775.1 tRNA lysidine(34) synthetase TilS [Metamycoplasma hyosynoviae]MDD1371266.1 tRNA lysidine(34) synthetase TilS [Metamycoplasma hyosynoviae]
MEDNNLLNNLLVSLNNKKVLVGVSGGPDSMFLLFLLRNYKNIVVAHVNYNKREDSTNDENIVREFCKKHEIQLEVLSLKNTYIKGNFQEIARNERYEFYKEIYDKYSCEILLLAHHKDDFLETAIMQFESKRYSFHYGIKETNRLLNMNIYRPLIHIYWKDEILELCKQNKINYAVDYTNAMDIYTRNKIRNSLKKISLVEKENLYKNYISKNNELSETENMVDKKFNEWKDKNFEVNFLKDEKFYKELIYKLINTNYEKVLLSSKKIENIYQFLISQNRTSKYKLDNQHFLVKRKNLIIFN